MLQTRVRTDSYAEMGGRFVQKFHFLCISSGNPEILRSELNTEGYRKVVCGLFGDDLEGARICLMFVSAQAWYVAVQAGLPEKAADQIFDSYSQQLRRAREVEQILEAYISLMVSLAREVAVLRQPRMEDDRIQQAISYINDHVCESITAGQVAKALGLTQGYLSRFFKEKTGKTVVAFIQDVKMRNAKMLLRNRTLSVGEVMERLGYVSQSHFTKVFREHTGMTPARYRARQMADPVEMPMPEQGDSSWNNRLDIYRNLEAYRRQKGQEIQNYFLACIRRGNVAALEKELKEPRFSSEIYKLFCGRVDIAIEAFLGAWPQMMHVAGDSGVSQEEAVESHGEYVMRLYGCISVNEILDLNSEYILHMAKLVAQLS